MTNIIASDLYVATHPTRLRIAEVLSTHGSLTSCKLADIIDYPEEIIAFHLDILESKGLVDSTVGSGSPEVVTHYKLAEKFRNVLDGAPQVLSGVTNN